MKAKWEEREAARRLRRHGWSLRDISLELAVAKSSVSTWVRDIPLEAPQRPNLKKPPGAEPAGQMLVWDGAETRTCSKCRLVLPAPAFNRGQWYCRPCFKAYHRGRGSRTVEISNAAKERSIARAHVRVWDVLTSSACADCGERDPVVLEFDHVAGKRYTVASLQAAGAPIARIDEEIARCEVTCVNCHRRRTARRAGWLRSSPTWRGEISRFEPGRARNLRCAYEHLERTGCTDCRLRELAVLDFDHVGEKRFNVMVGVWNGVRLASLEAEIAACVVRCGNCHRRKTAERGNHSRWRATRALGS